MTGHSRVEFMYSAPSTFLRTHAHEKRPPSSATSSSCVCSSLTSRPRITQTHFGLRISAGHPPSHAAITDDRPPQSRELYRSDLARAMCAHVIGSSSQEDLPISASSISRTVALAPLHSARPYGRPNSPAGPRSANRRKLQRAQHATDRRSQPADSCPR